MRLAVIEVPYMAGDDRPGSSRGPRRYVEAGAGRLLAGSGHAIRHLTLDRGGPFRDTVSSSFDVCAGLVAAVGQAIQAAELPIVLAGGCDASKGIIGGVEHNSCGVIWLDAHGDFNTPESTISGYFPGMSMAVITGDCYRQAWERIGDATPIASDRVVMIGVRDVDPLESERLERSGIRVIGWREGQPVGDVDGALAELRRRVDEVYLHIDIDSLDPAVAPGVVDRPVPGGLSVAQAEATVRAVTERFRLRAVALTVYNPDCDVDDRTLRAGLRLIEVIGERLVD